MRLHHLSVFAIVFALPVWARAEIPQIQGRYDSPRSFGAADGYPRAMGFRRASWDSLEDILYQDHVVIGTATRNYRDQEQIALEFKRRRPDARVQVQYFWNAFPRVLPFQIAKATSSVTRSRESNRIGSLTPSRQVPETGPGTFIPAGRLRRAGVVRVASRT